MYQGHAGFAATGCLHGTHASGHRVLRIRIEEAVRQKI